VECLFLYIVLWCRHLNGVDRAIWHSAVEKFSAGPSPQKGLIRLALIPPKIISGDQIKALFKCKKYLDFDTVALLFVFDKYCPIMN